MTNLERIKELEEKARITILHEEMKQFPGGVASHSQVTEYAIGFLLRSFNVMREIAIKEGTKYKPSEKSMTCVNEEEIDAEFEQRMSRLSPGKNR